MIEKATEAKTAEQVEKGESLTYLMFPFYFPQAEGGESLINALTDTKTLWQRCENKVENGILYEFINPNVDIATSPFLVFSLKRPDANADAHVKTCINRVWNRIEASFETRDGQTFNLEFKRTEGNWNSAKLLVSPHTREGLLVLGVGIKGDNYISADDAIDFSYNLCKIDGQQQLRLSGYDPNADLSGLSEIERQRKQAKINACNEILETLVPNVVNPKSRSKQTFLEESKATGLFKLTDIIEFLMQNLPDWKLFNTQRAHVFNYFSTVKNNADCHLTEKDKQNIILFTRCENTKYEVLLDEFENSGSYTSTFKNIYMGGSTEGACLYTLQSGGKADPFIKQFALSQLQHRYLWLYSLALMQRHSLLQMVAWISKADPTDLTKSDEFYQNYEHFCQTKNHGYFINISPYAHHNKFYKFCLENLDVCNLYAEVEDKMRTIDSYLQMRNNQLLEERKKIREQEKAEREEQQRIATEMREQEKAEREKQQDRIATIALWVSIFAALITAPETMHALICMTQLSLLACFFITIAFITIFILIIWLIWKKSIRQ